MNSSAAAAFAALQAIGSGEWDNFLPRLALAIREREDLLNPRRPPRRPLPPGQVWVRLNGADPPHWAIRGTGAVLDEETEREHRARQERLRQETGTND